MGGLCLYHTGCQENWVTIVFQPKKIKCLEATGMWFDGNMEFNTDDLETPIHE